MRQLPIVYFILAILLPLISLCQRMSNPPDLIKKYKVKKVFIFRTNLSDTTDSNTESLVLTFSYDTIGRRIAIQLIEKLSESGREQITLLQELLKEAKEKKEQYDN